MKRASAVVAILLLSACGQEAAAPENTSASPSPLLALDMDRLWILVRASRVGDGQACADSFLKTHKPGEPPYNGTCILWTQDFAAYLAVNGLPTVEPAHLQAPEYWAWALQMRERIANCKKAASTSLVGASSQEMKAVATARAACDPYDDARQNQNLTPEQLGVRYPDV